MSVWYKGESCTYPQLIDVISSKKWVYIRRNIEEHEREDEFSGETILFYSFEETKIPKDVWAIFEKETDNSERLADVEEAITELYGIF